MPDPAAAEPPTVKQARVPPGGHLRSGRVVAVLRAQHSSAYRPVVDVLVEAGITSIELTLTTAATLVTLPSLVQGVSGTAEVGVGTVLTADQAEAVLQAGAAYVVTPAVLPEVVAVTARHHRPSFVGGLTPTEVLAGWDAGASAVKVFPAGRMGPSYLAALHGPFPTIALLPSGGIGIEDIPAWLQAGALAVSLGGELIGDALAGGDLRALALRARRVRALIDERHESRT